MMLQELSQILGRRRDACDMWRFEYIPTVELRKRSLVPIEQSDRGLQGFRIRIGSDRGLNRQNVQALKRRGRPGETGRAAQFADRVGHGTTRVRSAPESTAPIS